ncbi:MULTISPECIES: serine hydrolase domain-containing protein [Rufibacter]|nr:MULTISPECIES: serine hydrolase [Rufibacter]
METTPTSANITFPSSVAHALDHLLVPLYPAKEPGLTIIAQAGGRDLYKKSFGCANPDTGQQLHPATNFRMASLTKQFTAMAVAMLEKEGLFTFDDPIGLFLTQMQQYHASVTIRHLLTHTSGLPDYEDVIADNRPRQVTDQEVLEMTAARSQRYFTSGHGFRYSNTGYVLLGLLVKKVSDKPIRNYLKEKIFQPLGMQNTVFYQPGSPIPHRAMGYAPNRDKFIFSDQSPCSATQGDGCLYTSVQEYLCWHHALHHHPEFLLAPLLHKVHTAVPDFPNSFYGMGWFFTLRKNGSLELCHSGNTCGFSHLVVSVPEKEAIFLAFSNRADNADLYSPLFTTVSSHPSFQQSSKLVWALPELTR